jgi:hypothetical protein
VIERPRQRWLFNLSMDVPPASPRNNARKPFHVPDHAQRFSAGCLTIPTCQRTTRRRRLREVYSGSFVNRKGKVIGSDDNV